MPDEVDRALDALYAGPPTEFVAGRDRIAADLRRAGDGGRAAAVKALRRPTVAAWALNRVAHEAPAAVATFLDASHALRRLQEAGDDPGALREAITAQRAARRALVDAVDAVLAEHGMAATSARDEIAATIDAAALDDALAGAVMAGRLEKAGGTASAFSALRPNPDAPRPAPTPRRAPARSADAPPARRAPDAAEQRRQAARDARILAAASRVDEARRDVDAAEAALAEAGTTIRAARRAVEEAQRAQDAAARTLDRARAAEERARAAYDRI